jgi:hypothetical protein
MTRLNDKVIITSYELAQTSAKYGTPHAYGEKLILPAKLYMYSLII